MIYGYFLIVNSKGKKFKKHKKAIKYKEKILRKIRVTRKPQIITIHPESEGLLAFYFAAEFIYNSDDKILLKNRFANDCE